jgi:hypothetical protein
VSVHLSLPVEAIEWVPRWSFWGVAENFARVQILLTVFDGDPDKWLDLIERCGTSADDADVPFLIEVKQRLEEDPATIEEMRRIVGEFTAAFGRVVATS